MTTAPANIGRLTLRPGGPDDAGPDVLGLWAIDAPSLGSSSFAPGTRPDAELSIWGIDLPANPELADAVLGEAEARLAEADKVLMTVPARLVEIGRDRQTGRPGEVAFGSPVGGSPPLLAKARLLIALDELWTGGDLGPTAFGPLDKLTGLGGEAVAQFRAFVARVSRSVLFYARVETKEAGRLLAQTVVSWTGDSRTHVGVGLDAARAARHGRVLALAMSSREAMLRTIALAARGAVILATLLSGGGAIAAIPAAWRFIRDVLALVRADKASGVMEVHGGQ